MNLLLISAGIVSISVIILYRKVFNQYWHQAERLHYLINKQRTRAGKYEGGVFDFSTLLRTRHILGDLEPKAFYTANYQGENDRITAILLWTVKFKPEGEFYTISFCSCCGIGGLATPNTKQDMDDLTNLTLEYAF
jgi:hypothetical protein